MFKCYDKGSYVQFAAKRLTADSWSMIINDFYNRPLPERPYYYIHNVNTSVDLPTNLYNPLTGSGTDQDTESGTAFYIEGIGETATGESSKLILQPNSKIYDVVIKDISGISTIKDAQEKVTYKLTENGQLNAYYSSTNYLIFKNISDETLKAKSSSPGSTYAPIIAYKQESTNEFPREITLTNMSSRLGKESLVEKPANIRHSNSSTVRCEIRYGKDSSVFELVEVVVDYIKSPQYIRLTQEQIDLTEDTSQILEFPDYVCQEIINELVHIVMEVTSDQRLQSHVAISQSIASPTQQQAQPRQQA